MPDKRPAMTAAEWIQYGDDLLVMADWAADKRPFGPDRRFNMEEKRLAVAAIALHKQPFGFTHEDEALLEAQARLCEERGLPGDREMAARLRELQDRISALLPPKEAERVLKQIK